MKFTRLTLHNFGPFEALDLDLTANTYLVGLNGGGKTTILNAIRMALHGWCAATAKGRGQSVVATGARDLIRQGANKATVTLEFNQGTIQLEIPKSTKNKPTWEWVDLDGELHETPADLYGTALPEHWATCATFGGQLSPEILQEYLSRAVSVEDAVAASNITESEIRMVYSGPLNDIDELREVGQQAFDKRTGLNREIKRIEANLDEDEIATPAGWADGCIDKTQAELTTAKTALAALYEERGRATQGIDPDEGENKVGYYTEQIVISEELVDQMQEFFDAAKETEAEARTEHIGLVREMEAQQAELSKLGQPFCPTCKRAFESYPEAQVADIKSKIAELEPQAKAATHRLRDAETSLTTATHNLEQAQARLAQNTKQRDQWETKLEQPRYTAEQLEQLETKIATAQQRETELQDNLANFQDYERQVRDQAYLENLKAERAVLSAMVEAFRDGKAVRPLLDKAVADFEAQINDVLPARIRVTVDVTGKKPAPMVNGKAWALASTGQRSIVRYAIATEFAQWGAPVIFDDINDLDAVNRRALIDHMKRHDEVSYVTAGTWQYGEEPPKGEVAEALDPVVFYWVDGVKQ